MQTPEFTLTSLVSLSLFFSRSQCGIIVGSGSRGLASIQNWKSLLMSPQNKAREKTKKLERERERERK